MASKAKIADSSTVRAKGLPCHKKLLYSNIHYALLSFILFPPSGFASIYLSIRSLIYIRQRHWFFIIFKICVIDTERKEKPWKVGWHGLMTGPIYRKSFVSQTCQNLIEKRSIESVFSYRWNQFCWLGCAFSAGFVAGFAIRK